jgi:dTDP-4-amino-4,6-dideoxygalactose transaminase
MYLKLKNKLTIAIQAIHLGGNLVEINKIQALAKKYNLIFIEDCAQAFGSKYLNKNIGSFSAISCFSLTKNFFSITGGVLATNKPEMYQNAVNLQNSFQKVSQKFIYYRLLRDWFESNRSYISVNLLYILLMKIKDYLFLEIKNEEENNF